MRGLARDHRGIAVRVALAAGVLAMQGCGGSDPRSSAPAIAAAAPLPAAAGGASGPIQIRTVSNRADLVSGGDALVELVLPVPAVPRGLRVSLNGADVTSSFERRASGRVLGLLVGLRDGDNVLTASIGSSHGAKLVITNHPRGGPVIAGPQTQPFVCATPVAQPATATSPATNASGLSTSAVDAQCNIATETRFWYRSTSPGCSTALPDPNPPAAPPANPCFRPYTPGQPPPADLALASPDHLPPGTTVPYIVRVERGTIDRGIFDIAVLFDPSQGWEPWAPQRGWNGKLVYTFGASTGQPRRQFRSEQSWTDDAALSRGFMVADNSMTDSLFDSNRVYDAEALLMMKEHIVETYGEIRYTIGNGCSGGSIQQLTASSIFPGLLDGIQPTCTYPDSETTSIEVADCVLLVNYFDSPAFKALVAGLTPAQIAAKKAAIAGHVDQTGCGLGWNNSFGNNSRPGNFVPRFVIDLAGTIVPVPSRATNNCQLLPGQVYDPVANPDGPRCGGADNAISIFGPAPGTTNRGQATNDNVGVQYGLRALAAGAISPEEFVTLNERIGGFDDDRELTARKPGAPPVPARAVADLPALTTAYRSGIVSGGQLAATPILDVRGWDDSSLPPGVFGIHHFWRSYGLRDRLDHANGNHGNHVMWRFSTGLLPPPGSDLLLRSFLTMDRWLANIEADRADVPREVKVVANRPEAAVDVCFLPTDPNLTTPIADAATCDEFTTPGRPGEHPLLPHASPRQIAGGPRSEDVLKCQLEPLDLSDPAYGGAAFTEAQKARLQAVFPAGVCDWSRPGVNQVPFAGPLTFQDGPGGRPLGPAPVSTPL